MGFLTKVKEGISNKFAADQKFRAEVREASMAERKAQAIRVAKGREVIRANATLAKERTRYNNSPVKVFKQSVAPKNIKRKLKKAKRLGVTRGVQAVVAQTRQGKYNPITGRGIF